MDQEYSTSMEVPLDSNGFLRRQCPTCERELKWLAGDDRDEDVEPEVPDGGYYCPYCAIQAPPDAWFTEAQIAQAQAVLIREVVHPEMKKYERRGFKVELNSPDEPASPTESDDMRRVDFGCHADAPVKVLDDWDGPVHCPMCGTAVDSAS